MSYFEELIEIYETELDIPNNEICKNCDSDYKQPLLPWQIGKKYFTESGGIFIAGKPHRGTPGMIRNSGVIDGRDIGEKLFFNKSWAYWTYTREVLNLIYGTTQNSWDHIVFSNIVKCSSTDTSDRTSWSCAKKCILENEVIFKEIELLKPRKVIFFTWSMHRSLLNDIPSSIATTVTEHTNINFKRQCGAKQLGWWERTFESTWGKKVDFLIIGHPERMKKEEYIRFVHDWLQSR